MAKKVPKIKKFPEVDAKDLGQEIEAEMKNIERAQILRDVAIELSSVINSLVDEPDKLATKFILLSTFLQKKYPEFDILDIQKIIQKFLVDNLTPEQKEKFEKHQSEPKVYHITEKDLPTQKDLEDLNIKILM